METTGAAGAKLSSLNATVADAEAQIIACWKNVKSEQQVMDPILALEPG